MTKKAGNFLGNCCRGLQSVILCLSTCSCYVKAECIFDINKKWFIDKCTKSMDKRSKQTRYTYVFLRDHSAFRTEAAIILTWFHVFLKLWYILYYVSDCESGFFLCTTATELHTCLVYLQWLMVCRITQMRNGDGLCMSFPSNLNSVLRWQKSFQALFIFM